MLLPSILAAQGVRYRDPACEALLPKWRRGARFGGPVLLSFTGAPRFGLTAAAHELAARLERPLLRAPTASPYIGETEKNLRRAFARAEAAGAVLLFDEADALFGKRSQPASAQDGQAQLDRYRGLAVLLFDAPQEAGRRRGWLQPLVVRFPPA